MSSSLLAQRPPAIDFIPPSTVDCDSAFALTTPSRTRESRLPFVSGGITSTTPSPIKLHKSTRNKDGNIRVKSVCRYGPGCTHIADNNHREKFWHPSVQELTGKSKITSKVHPLFAL